MKFSSLNKNHLVPTPDPQVGDVFLAKSTGPKGYRNGTRYWLIVSITPGTRAVNDNPQSFVHHMLGLDNNGNIVSTTSYGGHVMMERPRVGHCKDISTLNLNIQWEPIHE